MMPRRFALIGHGHTASDIIDFDEATQDAIGTILTDTATIDFTYTDATPSITAAVIADSISNSLLANMAQATVKGRAAGAGTGDPTDLTAAQLITILTAADGSGSLLDADFLDGQSGAYFLDSANFTGTNWTDLTDAGATTLHKHDHGGMDGLADDDHPQYPLAGGTETIAGAWTFSTDLTLAAASQIGMNFNDTSATSGERFWRYLVSGGDFYFQGRSDANGSSFTALQFERATTALTAIRIPLDTTELTLGAGNDLSFYHDGTDSFLDNNTGAMKFVAGSTVGASYSTAGVWTFAVTPLKLTVASDAHIEVNNTTASGNSYHQFLLNTTSKLLIGVAGTTAAVINDLVANDAFYRLPSGTHRFCNDAGTNTSLAITATDLTQTGPSQMSYNMVDLSAGSDEKWWRWIASGGDFFFQGRTDINGGAFTAMTFTRAGTALTNINLMGSLQVDASATATHTRMLVYDVDNATLERVTVGAADSGGAGFKVLRIPN